MLNGFNQLKRPQLLSGLMALLMTVSMASPALALETIEQMVTRLCAANNLPRSTVKKAIIQQSNQINAGTDGQNIVVYSGLWNKLATDDARAFVVGHELGHIVLHHSVKSVGRQVGLNLLGRLVGSYLNPVASTATFYGLQLTGLKFDRGQEYQADDEGLKLMWKAGYDPHAVNHVFGVLNQADGSGTPEFLRSHPMSKNRLDGLVAKYDRLGPPGGTAARNYQSALPQDQPVSTLSMASGSAQRASKSVATLPANRRPLSGGNQRSWLDKFLNPTLP